MKYLLVLVVLVSCAFAAPAPIAQSTSSTAATVVGEDQTIATDWISGGLKVTVTTPKRSGEGNSNWMQRHKQAVDAARVTFPPDAQLVGSNCSATTAVGIDVLKTAWIDASGLRDIITTRRAPTETVQAWHAHHQSAVAAGKYLFG